MIQLGFSPDELALLERLAARRGQSVSDYARRAVLAYARRDERKSFAHAPGKLGHLSGSSVHEWSEEQLQSEGLPLYWSLSWVERMLAEHETWVGVSEASGYHETTLSNYARRVHGISLKQHRKETARAKVRRLWRRSKKNEAARLRIAAEVGVSRSSVVRWTEDLR